MVSTEKGEKMNQDTQSNNNDRECKPTPAYVDKTIFAKDNPSIFEMVQSYLSHGEYFACEHHECRPVFR